MIEERLTQCCVHVASVNEDRDDGHGGHQCAPFCALQAWAPLSQTRLSTRTGSPLIQVGMREGDGARSRGGRDPRGRSS